jgi:hypothetical protein
MRNVECGVRSMKAGIGLVLALPLAVAAQAPLAPSTSAVVLQARPVQDPTPRGRPFVVDVAHWGKWATLGATIGFQVGSTTEQRRADRLQDELRDRCVNDPPACTVTQPDGAYLNADTESLYQRGVDADRAARRYMLLGQLSLLTSVALFVIDLRHGDGAGPDNVPFRGDDRSFGLSLRF